MADRIGPMASCRVRCPIRPVRGLKAGEIEQLSVQKSLRQHYLEQVHWVMYAPENIQLSASLQKNIEFLCPDGSPICLCPHHACRTTNVKYSMNDSGRSVRRQHQLTMKPLLRPTGHLSSVSGLSMVLANADCLHKTEWCRE